MLLLLFIKHCMCVSVFVLLLQNKNQCNFKKQEIFKIFLLYGALNHQEIITLFKVSSCQMSQYVFIYSYILPFWRIFCVCFFLCVSWQIISLEFFLFSLARFFCNQLRTKLPPTQNHLAKIQLELSLWYHVQALRELFFRSK